MKYILLNNNSSVAYDDSDATDIKVYIDGKLHDFKESTENRIDYAIATNRNKYSQTLNNQLQQKLTELNGGIDVIFNESEYPEVIAIPSFEELEEIIEAQDPTRKLLQQQTTIAQQQIQVTKAMALPKFEAGYHYQGILGQNFHGARIGMSIPLWENKNRVKQSMAELEMNEVQLNEHKVEHYYNIKSLYEKYTNLQKTLDEYQTVLESINSIQLLDKALRFGEITTIQYFLEASYYYQAGNNYLLTEKEYQDVIAELLKYQL